MPATTIRTLALALLPERQAHYDTCCQTLARANAAGVAKSILPAQQSVGFALAVLNTTRAAAGLSVITGPHLRSLDELLTTTAQAA